MTRIHTAESQHTKAGATPNLDHSGAISLKEYGQHTPLRNPGGCQANMVLRCISCRTVIIDIRSDAIQMEYCGNGDLGTAIARYLKTFSTASPEKEIDDFCSTRQISPAVKTPLLSWRPTSGLQYIERLMQRSHGTFDALVSGHPSL